MKGGYIAIAAGLALLAAIAVTWAFYSQRGHDPSAGSLRIGYAIEPPYAFYENGQLKGESIDSAEMIATRLGVKRVEWINCEFDRLIPHLRAGEFDMIASGFFITPERRKLVAFVRPAIKVRQGLLVPRGNPLKLKSYSDAVVRKVRLAVLKGSFEESLVRKLGASSADLIIAPDVLTARVAVESGRADALALSVPAVRWMAANSSGGGALEALDELEQSASPSFTAFAFRLDDKDRVKSWNAGLMKFIGSQAHLEIVRRYAFTGNDIPSPAEQMEALK